MTGTHEMILALERIQGNPKSLKCVCDAGENKWHSVPETSQPTFAANWMTIGVTCNGATIQAMGNTAAIPGFPESEFLLFACRRCGTIKAVKI